MPIYTFKHALVQDAAYDSLLKSRRQELHAKIARVIEAAVPEYQTDRTRGAGASPHCRGPCRSRYSALAGRWRAGVEAHGPDRSDRPSQPGARTGLHLASVIGNETPANWGCAASWAPHGWRSKAGPAPEVWTSLHPALALAKSLERHDALLPILWGLIVQRPRRKGA